MGTHASVATLDKPYTLVLNRECATVAEANHQMLLPCPWRMPGALCSTSPSLVAVAAIPSHLCQAIPNQAWHL